jgi:hypothetical protein
MLQTSALAGLVSRDFSDRFEGTRMNDGLDLFCNYVINNQLDAHFTFTTLC